MNAFGRWLNEINQNAFSNFTDQVLWVLTGVTILIVWVICVFGGYTTALIASMPFLVMWLSYLTGSSVITGVRDAQKRATYTPYVEAKARGEAAGAAAAVVLEEAAAARTRATREHEAPPATQPVAEVKVTQNVQGGPPDD